LPIVDAEILTDFFSTGGSAETTMNKRAGHTRFLCKGALATSSGTEERKQVIEV
jgi:hypothetical protein